VIGSRRIFGGIGDTADPPAFSVCGSVIPSFFQELLTPWLAADRRRSQFVGCFIGLANPNFAL
jgi:hypothetical protein